MNSLDVDITGRHVILLPSWFKDPKVAADVRERVFLAQGGFGCSPTTIGAAVFGEFPIDGERVRIEGYQIERFATDDEVAAAKDERNRRAS